MILLLTVIKYFVQPISVLNSNS